MRVRSSPLRLGGMCSRRLRTFLPQILAQTSLSGLYNGDAGQVIDPPPCVGGQRTRTEEITRRHLPCVQTTHQTSHRARFFGDLVVDLDVEASRARYGAERADQLSRWLQARRGHASAKKPRGKAVRGGRYPQT